MKCPKSVEVCDINFPYGETRFCPFRHLPCVLETDEEEKCGIATLLLNVRDSFAHVFDDTWQVKGVRDIGDVEVSMDWDLAAEKAVGVVYEDLARYFN